MPSILYAITKDGFFCKKETLDKKIDNLDWMRISTDRKFFKELTTIQAHQVLLIGSKTARVMPRLPNRQLVILSSDPARGQLLKYALQKYTNGLVIGGAEIIKNCMHFKNRDFINSVMTVRLPLIIPKDTQQDFIPDPLIDYKESGVLKLSNKFYIHTENYEQPTIVLEMWRPTYA